MDGEDDLQEMEYGDEDSVKEITASSSPLNRIKEASATVLAKWNSLPGPARIVIIAVVVVVALLCLIAVSMGAGFAWGKSYEYNKYEGGNYVFRYSWEYSFDRSNPLEAPIQESNEYQVNIHENRFNSTLKREAEINAMLDAVGDLLGMDLHSKKAVEESLTIYNETQYETDACGYKYSELRTRDYWLGKKTNTSSMSINIDTKKDKTAGATFPLSPSARILEDDDDSEQKLEQDVHACFHKYNRKTKLKNLPFGYTIDSCGQLHENFPDAPGLGDVDPDTPVPTKETCIWVWEYMIDGLWWYDTTKFKLIFTLYYNTFEDALSGENGPSGDSEFSMRFYSMGKGMADFEHDVLAAVGEIYMSMLEQYDRKYPCD